MKIITQLFLITILSMVSLPPTARAQSNLEFFFGTKQEKKSATIKKVISADTLLLDSGKTIKLIGLKAFYVHRKKQKIKRNKHGFIKRKETSAETPLNSKLFDKATSILNGKKIRLEYDEQKQNQELQTLAYVFLEEDGDFINALFLELGICNLQIRIPNTKYEEKLREAYQKGRLEQKGFHGQY